MLAILAKLEWIGLVFQFIAVFIGGIIDTYYRSPGNAVLLAIAAIHVPAIILVQRHGGPFTHGGKWLWLQCSQAVIVPLVAGLFIIHGRYGEGPGTPLCNYAVPTILFMTMYVQVVPLSLPGRIVSEILILGIPLLEPFILVIILNPEPTASNYKAMFVGQIQLVTGYLGGKAVVAVCRMAVGRQLGVQRQNYDEFFNFLHSHVKAGLAAVRAVQPNIPAMLDKLEELELAVSNRRLEMLFVHEQIPLAVVISERIRAFTGKLSIVESPRVGGLTVAQPVGALISRALGDLLKNVVVHGGPQVRIRCAVDAIAGVTVEVIDNGPGFDPTVLDDHSKSLFRLRSDARGLGGDLDYCQVGGEQALRLRVPFKRPEGIR